MGVVLHFLIYRAMKEELKLFEHPEFGMIRMELIDGEPWFCGSDVCDALGYENSRRTLSLHCREGGVSKRYIGVETGKRQDGSPATQKVEMNFINEGNLYRLILRSQLPSAEKFESWVCDEVLPSLRRRGRYELPKMLVPDELPSLPRGHVFSADYMIFGEYSVRRVLIEGRAYYCLVDIQLAAGMGGKSRSQLARSIYRSYTFKILTRTNRRLAAYISGEGVKILLSRSHGEDARRFLAEFLKEREKLLPAPDLKRLLEVVVRTADAQDRVFLYEWYKRMLNS